MKGIRVNEIDLLRFLAALAVVFFHLSFRGYTADAMTVMPYPALSSVSKYGYLGVEIFFMISGFVILMTAANGSLRDFAISRVVRLYPAFWACCTITFLVTIAIGGSRHTATIGQYLVNMTMLSGFVGVPSIDGAYWSLYVEIKFYALVALVLVAGKIHKSQMFIAVWLVASIALAALQIMAPPALPLTVLRYFLITDYSAFFIAGATYFLIWSEGLSPARVAIIIAAWLLAMFNSISALPPFEDHYNTSMSAYIVAGIITGFFAVMMLVSLRLTGFFGRSRWLLAGAITYPLYLLHQHIGYMIFNIAYPIVNVHVIFWGTIFALIVFSYAVHFFIEKRLSPSLKAVLNRLADRIERLTIRQRNDGYY